MKGKIRVKKNSIQCKLPHHVTVQTDEQPDGHQINTFDPK